MLTFFLFPPEVLEKQLTELDNQMLRRAKRQPLFKNSEMLQKDTARSRRTKTCRKSRRDYKKTRRDLAEILDDFSPWRS